jgi:hypothetical protein
MIKKNPDGTTLKGNDRYEGYCADLAKEICEQLGIAYEIRLVPDNKYGEKTNDGTWNGMIGELTRRVSNSILCSQQ